MRSQKVIMDKVLELAKVIDRGSEGEKGMYMGELYAYLFCLGVDKIYNAGIHAHRPNLKKGQRDTFFYDSLSKLFNETGA